MALSGSKRRKLTLPLKKAMPTVMATMMSGIKMAPNWVGTPTCWLPIAAKRARKVGKKLMRLNNFLAPIVRVLLRDFGFVEW